MKPRHYLQLFDGAESRAVRVAAFLDEGLRLGDTVLVVITPAHWDAVAARLGAAGVALDEAARSGQIAVHDAERTLERLTEGGRPRLDRFAPSIGALVRDLLARGAPLRIYGEMVDLLAGRGDLDGALEVEAFWNARAAEERFTLLCGYASARFGDPCTAPALRAICDAHTHAQASPHDTLGSFLLSACDRRDGP